MSSRLESKSLLEKEIGTEHAETIVALRDPGNSTKSIELWNTRIGIAGANAVAESLENKNCIVEKIDLRNCEIGSAGATAIAKSLESTNCKVTSIDLIWNSIEFSGAKAIAKSLESANCKVTSINLSSNSIGDEGATSIAKSLESANCKVASINLSVNRIGVAGATAIAESLESANCKVTSINLTGNSISQPILNQITAQLDRNKSKAASPASTDVAAKASTPSSQSAAAAALKIEPSSIEQRVQAAAPVVSQQEVDLSELARFVSRGVASAADMAVVLSKMSAMQANYQLSSRDLSERNHVSSKSELRQYCQRAQRSFNEAFVAAMTISCNLFSVSDPTSVQALNFMSNFVSSIPFASTVFCVASEVTSQVCQARIVEQFSNVSDLVPTASFSDMDRFSEKLSRRLAISNEREILQAAEGRKREYLERFADSLKNELSKLSPAVARGFFGPGMSPVELLALDSAKAALTYVLQQTPVQIIDTKQKVSEGRQSEVIEEIVAQVINRAPTRLSHAVSSPAAPVPVVVSLQPASLQAPDSTNDRLDAMRRMLQEQLAAQEKKLESQEEAHRAEMGAHKAEMDAYKAEMETHKAETEALKKQLQKKADALADQMTSVVDSEVSVGNQRMLRRAQQVGLAAGEHRVTSSVGVEIRLDHLGSDLGQVYKEVQIIKEEMASQPSNVNSREKRQTGDRRNCVVS